MRPEDQFTFAAVTLFGGLVLFLISLPLVYRKIPINRFYGIRFRESFRSPERWYEINEYGGRLIARWTLVITLAGALAFAVPFRYFAAYAVAAGIAILVSLFAPLIQTVRWVKRSRKT